MSKKKKKSTKKASPKPVKADIPPNIFAGSGPPLPANVVFDDSMLFGRHHNKHKGRKTRKRRK